jgi:hypothetical protein
MHCKNLALFVENKKRLANGKTLHLGKLLFAQSSALPISLRDPEVIGLYSEKVVYILN